MACQSLPTARSSRRPLGCDFRSTSRPLAWGLSSRVASLRMPQLAFIDCLLLRYHGWWSWRMKRMRSLCSVSPHTLFISRGAGSSFCSPAEGNIVLGQLSSPRPHGPPSQTWGDTWESFIFVYTPLQVCLLVREPQDHLEDARKTSWTCPGSGQRSGSCPVRSGLFLLSRRFVFSFLLKTLSQGSQREFPTPRLWA